MAITENVLTPFKAYLKDISGVNVHIGDIDIGANDYPCWTITIDGDIKTTFLNIKAMDVLFNVKCNLFVDRSRSDEAYKIIFKTLKKINQFQIGSGSGIGDEQVKEQNEATISSEYLDNLIHLTLPFRIKTIIQEED